MPTLWVSGSGGAAVEPGEGGALEIKGATVFARYYNNPEATAKEFTEDDWFKTGGWSENPA